MENAREKFEIECDEEKGSFPLHLISCNAQS
jgi:hypothetical protein